MPKQTVEGQKQGEKEIEVFRTWFEKYVLQADEDGCSETILVLPWTQGEPSYRDEYGEYVSQYLVITIANILQSPILDW